MISKLISYYLKSQYWQRAPIKKVKAMQLKRFKAVFEHARIHSPFYADLYKKAGVDNLDIQSFEDIEKLPVVTKQMLRDSAYDHILTVPLSDDLNLHKTSGSSGVPFRVYQNKYEDYTAHVRVFSMLQDIGYKPWKRITMLTRYETDDSFEVEQDLSLVGKLQRVFGLFQREIISVYEKPAEIIRKVEANPPYILWSTPSVLDMVAVELERRGTPWNIPKVVLTSENVLPHMYQRFYKYIGKTVVSHYGLMESTTISYGINDSGRRKVFAYSSMLEYIDQHEDHGKTLGTPVVTNLVNYTMPFIRYYTGDDGVVLQDKEFPHRVMGNILGRLDDVLDFPDGSKFVHHHAYEMFTDFEDCEHYKFVQYGDGPIIMQMVKKPSSSAEAVEAEARRRWAIRYPDRNIEVAFVDGFAVSPKTGKVKNIEKFEG